MFPSKTDTPADNLDKVINTHLAHLQDLTPSHAEYPDAVKQLAALYSLRNESVSKPLSADAKLTAAVNLAGIIMILKHEQVGVITSKALGFIAKLR